MKWNENVSTGNENHKNWCIWKQTEQMKIKPGAIIYVKL